MTTKHKMIQYNSVLAPMINQLIREKRACGYKYDTETRILKRFDCFLFNKKVTQNELPKEIVLEWVEKKSHEQASTQNSRICCIRNLARLMVRLGYSAYILPNHFGTKRTWIFLPHIFTQGEIQKIFQAIDKIKPNPWFPQQHIIMPEIFRLLYGCGFRLGELLNLRIRDVDLKQGVIIIRGGKFSKDRLVPPSTDLVERLRIYNEKIEKDILEKRNDKSFFFPSRKEKTRLHNTTIYAFFRKILYQCGIPHGGRRKGPRVHDFRHSFAVHRLIKWYEEGCDLNAKLPFLVAYLGHQNFTGTQKYLHLTTELFPNLVLRMNKKFGDIIPGRTQL